MKLLEFNIMNGKNLITLYYLLDGVKKMEKNIGSAKTPGELHGVNLDTSESEEELMNSVLKAKVKEPLLI